MVRPSGRWSSGSEAKNPSPQKLETLNSKTINPISAGESGCRKKVRIESLFGVSKDVISTVSYQKPTFCWVTSGEILYRVDKKKLQKVGYGSPR